MGGWDIYCALCGGPLTTPWWESEQDGYDPAIIKDMEDPELAWLCDARVIGEVEESSEGPAAGPWGVWISPRSSAGGGYGAMSLEDLGEGDADPFYERMRMMNPMEIPAYDWDSDGPWCAPFHDRCRQVLCRYMDVSVSQLHKEVFFETLKAMATEDQNGRSLGINYGDVEPCMSQYWMTTDEVFVSNPIEVKGLHEAFANLEPLKADDPAIERVYDATGDPFSRLPSEILLLIMSRLDQIEILYQLRQASPAVANQPLSNGWWCQRLHRDMPWLWDLPSLETDALDWKKAYGRFHRGSELSSAKSTKIHGLCNRRRIWEQMCPIFAQEYREKEAQFREMGFVTPPVLHGIYAYMSQTLAAEKPWEMQAVNTKELLLDHFTDLPTAKPALLIGWTKNGELADLRIIKGANTAHASIEDLDIELERTDRIDIPDDDWITGFLVTNRAVEPAPGSQFRRRHAVGLAVTFVKRPPIQFGTMEEDPLIIEVTQGSFVVGLQVERVPRGTLRRIGLFEHPLERANDCLRVAAK